MIDVTLGLPLVPWYSTTSLPGLPVIWTGTTTLGSMMTTSPQFEAVQLGWPDQSPTMSLTCW